MHQFTFILIGLVYMAPYITSESLHLPHLVCEGNETEIRFHHPQTNVSISLQIGNRHPFYKDGEILGDGLSEDQVNRFQVQEIKENGLLIMVKIANVSRHDAGTYIAFVQGDEGSDIIHTHTESLEVEFPPGKPSCRYDMSSNIDIISNTWDIIECTADVGNIPGYIVCFQDGQPLPYANQLLQDTLTLSQKVWVRRDQEFLCCSSGYKNPFKPTLCTEFQSEKDRDITTFYHPYSYTTESEVSHSPDKTTLDITEVHNTTDMNEEETNMILCTSSNETHVLVLLYILLFSILIGSTILISLYGRKFHQIMKKLSIIEQKECSIIEQRECHECSITEQKESSIIEQEERKAFLVGNSKRKSSGFSEGLPSLKEETSSIKEGSIIEQEERKAFLVGNSKRKSSGFSEGLPYLEEETSGH